MPLKRRYTIERADTMRRYLTILDDGDFGWGDATLPFMVFKTGRSAELFRAFRMGPYGGDASVVRHTVH